MSNSLAILRQYDGEVKVTYDKRFEISQCSSIITERLLNIPMLCKYLCLEFFPCFSNHTFKSFFAILQLLPTCKRRVATEKVLGIQVDKEN